MNNLALPLTPLVLEKLIVQTNRIICFVRLSPEAPRYTTAAFVAQVCRSFPHLPYHACVNQVGSTFGAVMNNTSLPHLLEHMVIDLQVQASASSAVTFVGTTTWINKDAGCARIEVSFTDDLVALSAFRNAAYYLNRSMVGCAHDFSASDI